jgi:hypothetical protein
MKRQHQIRLASVLGVFTIVLILGCSSVSQLPFLATPTPTATSTPTATATPIPKPPVISGIKLNEYIEDGEQRFDIVISYKDPDGDAQGVHYEVARTTNPDVHVDDGTVAASASQQKAGAEAVGNWSCGGGTYDVTLEITITDKKHNTSNAKQITIPCDASSVVPTYSQIVATYPPGTKLCKSDVDVTGAEGDKLTLTIRFLSIQEGGVTIRCYGTKVTMKVDAELGGTLYKAGTLLTLDKNGDWIEVSSWE